MRQMMIAAAGCLLLSMPFACAQTSQATAPSVTQTNVSPVQVRKAGRALKAIIAIQGKYRTEMQSAASSKQQDAQQQQVVDAETRAIRQQGLTVAQYSQVVAAARTNPAVRRQLFAAANLGQK